MSINIKRYIYMENDNEVSEEIIDILDTFGIFVLFRIGKYSCIIVL